MSTFANGYKYRKLITIDNSKLGSGLSAEITPVLISHTDADLKTVANSGKVDLNPLLDIRFEDTSGNRLYHEVAGYVATTGAITAWVRMPITSGGTNTLYIYFGKALAQQTYNGIKLGIGSADRFTFGKNWYDAGFNQGEIRLDAANVKDVDGNTISLDPAKTVALVEDLTSYRGNTSGFPTGIAGFLMYTATATVTRFGQATSFNQNVIGVFRYGGAWYYDANGGINTFTPVSSDILIARAVWNASSDITRTVDYLEPIYAGEQQPSYTWCDVLSTFDETGFGSSAGNYHGYRSVVHMNSAPVADANAFTQDDKTVFETAIASVNMDSSNLSTSGKIGSALTFNGTDEYAWQIVGTVIYGGGQNTVGAWIKFDQLTTNQCIISRRTATTDAQGYSWFVLGGQFVVDLQGWSTYRWSTGWYPSATTWYLINVVCNGTTAKVYANGAEVASMAFTTNVGNSANNTWFGASHNSGTWGNYFDGFIDEYRSSNYAYSAARLLTEYNNQNSPSTFYSVGSLLVPGDAVAQELLHGHSLDSTSLVEHKTLSMQDASHSQILDALTLTQSHQLVVSDLSQISTLDGLGIFVQDTQLVIADLLHNHNLEDAIVSGGAVIYPANMGHIHTIDSVALLQQHLLEVAGLSQNQILDSVATIQDYILSVDEMQHAVMLDEIVFTQSHLLAVSELLHDQAVDNVILSQRHALEAQDMHHDHLLDNPYVFTQFVLEVQYLLQVQYLDGTIIYIKRRITPRDVIVGSDSPRLDRMNSNSRLVIKVNIDKPRIKISDENQNTYAGAKSKPRLRDFPR